MAPNNHAHGRDLQQDARAGASFTGSKYTASLRQLEAPLAQGLLGERLSARQLIAVLDEHELIGASGADPILGENGFGDTSWSFNGKTDFIEVALITEMLRMFTPIPSTETPDVGSYELKHTAETFLAPHCPYVSNGRLIWAAAALGLPVAEQDGSKLNLLIGVTEREHDYVRRMVADGQVRPGGHHHRPAGYTHLQTALERHASGEPIGDRWVRSTPIDGAAPFHEWLVAQAHRDDVVGNVAYDYLAGVRDSDHRTARTLDDLLRIIHEVEHSPAAYDAAVRAIAEWSSTSPLPLPIRTELINRDEFGHGGWGAGAGNVERYEYRCPCGNGTILEEHDNIPGFREHDVRIACDKCRDEWRFVDGRSTRDWGLEPVVSVSGSRTD